MTTLRIVAETSVPPDRVLEAAHDFSDRRAQVWPNISDEHLEVHELGDRSADVTEGTKSGPIYAWERCSYDWSQPGLVKATVTDSNVYASPGSSWQVNATPKDGGSEVEMIWVREFKRKPLAMFLGTVYRVAGKPLFRVDVRRALKNLEELEQGAQPAVKRD